MAVQAVPEEPKRRSGQITAPVARFEPSFTGKKYEETTATTIHKSTIHTDTHMSLNEGQAWDHVVHYTMTQLSMKAGLKRWGKKANKQFPRNYCNITCEIISDPSIQKTSRKQNMTKY